MLPGFIFADVPVRDGEVTGDGGVHDHVVAQQGESQIWVLVGDLHVHPARRDDPQGLVLDLLGHQVGLRSVLKLQN